MGTRGILLGAAFASMACAHIDAVSDADVSGAEIQVIARMSSETVSALDRRIRESCTCMRDDRGSFVWSEMMCEKDAELVQLVRTRAPYHLDLMLYYAGVKPDRPPSNAPAVPSSTELCPQ